MSSRKGCSEGVRAFVGVGVMKKAGMVCGLLLWLAGLFMLYQKGKSFEAVSAEGVEASEASPVLVFFAERAPSLRKVSFFGVTRALKQAVVGPLVSGRLEKRGVSVGEPVFSGQEIGRVDSVEYSHLVAIKKASRLEGLAMLEQGEADLRRMRGLYGDRVISSQRMEQEDTSVKVLRARCEVLKSQFAEAQRQLRETRIYAPFDGVVTRVCAEPGQFVSPGMPVMELANRSVELRISVPESVLEAMVRGSSVDVSFPMLGDRKVVGKILSVGDALGDDQKGVLFPVTVSLPQREWLRSGMTAEVDFNLPVKGDFLVPVAAICNGDGESDFLFVIRNGVAVKIAVSTGEALGDSVTVDGDLEEREPVVIGGHSFLSDGDAVEVRSWNGS